MYDAPYFVIGNTVSGAGTPMRGMAHGFGVVFTFGGVVNIEAGMAFLGGIEREAITSELYLNGIFAGTLDADNRISIPASTVNTRWSEIGPVPATAWESNADVIQNSGLWVARNVGDKVALEWNDTPQEDDFFAYVIYWDSGADATPSIELTVITNPSQRTFLTNTLAYGSYRFAIAYRDVAGNESPIGDDITVQVRPIPLAPAKPLFDYTSSRTVELTFTPPATDPASVRCYLIFSNWIPGAETLAPFANSESWQHVGVVYALPGDGVQTWESFELWEGVWKFSVAAMTAEGVISPSEEVTLNLQMIGGNLVQVADPPAAPILYEVRAIKDGAYIASIRLLTEVGITELVFVENGVEVGTITLDGVLDYTYTGATRAHGTVVELRARAKAGATVFTDSAPFVFTADAEPPTGDGVITGKAVL